MCRGQSANVQVDATRVPARSRLLVLEQSHTWVITAVELIERLWNHQQAKSLERAKIANTPLEIVTKTKDSGIQAPGERGQGRTEGR